MKSKTRTMTGIARRGAGLIVGFGFLAACNKPTSDAKPDAANKPVADTSKREHPEKAKAAAEAEKPAAPAQPWRWVLPKGLSQPPVVPADNPMSVAKVELGHQLFMDKRLSGDGSRSCYSCHQNHLGNADGRPKALGAFDKELPRNSPTIWNVGYHRELYWDGRAKDLEAQAIGALKGGNMGVAPDKLDAKAVEIASLPEYTKAITEVFELKSPAEVTAVHLAKALSAYERTLLCGDTPYDNEQLDDAAKRGKELFFGPAGCATCHNGENFTDGLYHNVGIGFDAAGKPLGTPDEGRAKPAAEQGEQYKFRTPTLRNVSKTAPYFHDGSVATLEEAVLFMAKGGHKKAPNIDPLLRDTAPTKAQVADLVAFLKSLDCPSTLVEIGDQSVKGIAGPTG
jgi:cytochrome c peroxidase